MTRSKLVALKRQKADLQNSGSSALLRMQHVWLLSRSSRWTTVGFCSMMYNFRPFHFLSVSGDLYIHKIHIMWPSLTKNGLGVSRMPFFYLDFPNLSFFRVPVTKTSWIKIELFLRMPVRSVHTQERISREDLNWLKLVLNAESRPIPAKGDQSQSTPYEMHNLYPTHGSRNVMRWRGVKRYCNWRTQCQSLVVIWIIVKGTVVFYVSWKRKWK